MSEFNQRTKGRLGRRESDRAGTPGRRKSDRTKISSALSTGQITAAVVGLCLAALVLLGYQFVSLRSALNEEARVQAGIIAENVTASLMFHDHETASEILRSLRYAPDLVAATVYDADGERFVTYFIPGSNGATESVKPVAQGGLFSVTIPANYRAKQVGKVVLVVSTDGVRTGLMRFALFLAITIAATFGVVVLILRRTRLRVAKAETELDYFAYTDPVTDLRNRRATYALLEAEMAQPEAKVALILIDLDNFKVVNDSAGHPAGDKLLRQVASILREVAGNIGVVGRIGGDEFAIVISPLAGRNVAIDMAHAVSAALQKPFQLEQGEVFATASIGICVYPSDASNSAELVSMADTALYQAKNSGRNQVVDFRAEMTLATQRRTRLERDLRRAIETEGLSVHYQPQFDCYTGRLVGVEALLRWPHDEYGFVSPSEFIPIAEETGLIVALGRWVLRRACKDVAGWVEQGANDLSVAVNVSTRQMREPRFIDDVARALNESGLPPANLELELTESLLMKDVDAAVAFMKQVRDAGVRLSIDDFGTGYSSLSYLQSFPINQLKIDRSFVQLLPQRGDTIARAIISLARGFGLTVVAEGVENHAQLEWLRAAGCDYVQGYLLGRPMPAAMLSDLLTEKGQVSAVGSIGDAMAA